MKKLKFFSVFIFSAILLSCSDKDHSDVEENSKDVETNLFIADKVFNNMEHDKDFAQIKGEFYVWQNQRNEIVFLSKSKVARNLLILQGAESKTSLKDGNYEVLYLKHSILVNNLDTGDLNYLKVPKPEEQKITNKIQEQIQFDSEIAGYGLIYSNIDFNSDKQISVELLKKQNSITIYLSSLNREGSQCGSGGVGSTSCTVYAHDGGGCSVSCGSGYYACCNLTCYCNPND